MNPIRHTLAALAAAFACAAPAAEHEGPAAAAAHAAPPARGAAPAPASASAPAEAPAAADAATDPMEHLRQRLAERLAAPRAAEPGKDVRLVVKAPPEATERRTAKVRAKVREARASVEAPAAAPAAPVAHHWSYEGAGGPQAWARLEPEFATCASGRRQSPIDIHGGLAVDLEPVQFDYKPSRFSVVDNGHTLQVNVAPGNSIDIRGRRFQLVQFHFHHPAEERIDGRSFELSLHLVHKDDQGHIAVVALLFDKGVANPVVQKVWNNLPLERNEENPARVPLELPDLLPADRSYYTYMGSLTTPPCTEGVEWVVMRQPQTMSGAQADLFARIYPMNARPLQALDGRRIIQSR